MLRSSILAALFAAALVALVAPAAAELPADPLAQTQLEVTPFAAYDYLAGEWEIFRHLASFKDGSVSYEHSLPPFRWRLEKENSTAHLSGFGWPNGTDSSEAEGALALRVEFSEGASGGKLQSGPNEDDLATLCAFSFSQARGSVPLSVGEWHGAEVGPQGATYVFQLSSPDRFTIVVTPKRGADLAAAARRAAAAAKAGDKAAQKKQAADSDDDEDDELASSGPASTGHPALSLEDLAGFDAIVYVAHRHKVEAEKTFFAKYGTMLMLGAMLVLNIFMRTRQSGQQLAARQATNNVIAAAGARQAQQQGKKSGVQIEEITDAASKKGN